MKAALNLKSVNIYTQNKNAICIHIHFVIHVYVLCINTVGKKLALKKQNSKLISIYNYCNKKSA